MPRPGDGYGLRADALPRLLARTTGWSGGDDALVFVDPPASAALEDALLDARIRAG
jgi:hypothetical protein